MQNEKTSKTREQIDLEFKQSSEVFEAKIRAKVKNSLNARYYPKNYEVNTSPSKAIPDQSMSLKTILDRFSKGLPITSNTQTPISGHTAKEGIDIRRLDLAEKETLLDELKEEIKQKTKPKPKPEPIATVPAAGLPLV